jgi:hypothetical protein
MVSTSVSVVAGGAQGDQRVGAQPGRPLPPLAFQPDRRAQDQGYRGPRGEVAGADRRDRYQDPVHDSLPFP